MLTNEQKEKIISLARSLEGRPYIYGTSPEKAPNEFDCSSFTQYLYKQIGIALPRSTILQAGDEKGEKIYPENGKNLPFEIGDLLFMRSNQGYYNDSLFPGHELYIGHVVLFLGNDEVIHAKQSVGKVTTQKLSELTTSPGYAINLIKRY